MASFPDLRPNRRSAKAESTAAPGNRARLLLAVSTALLLTASLAVSELATLRGARAHDASVFLTRELGPPLDRPLVRTPAHATPRLVKPALGGKLEIRDGGLKVTSGHASVSLNFGKARGAWRGHQHGVQRKLPFGSEAIVLGLNRVEQSLTVDERQGTRTWRWRLDAGQARSAAHAPTAPFGSPTGNKDSGLRILPVVVFDKSGKDITPRGLRWSLDRAGKTRWLQLRLNDADLPLPYVIDPIALVAACPGGGCANSTSTNATSVTVTRPASVATGSLMLAQVTLRNNDAITAPAGWTTTGNLRTSGASSRAAHLLPHRNGSRYGWNDVPVVVDNELGRRGGNPRLFRNRCHDPDRRGCDGQRRHRDDGDRNRSDHDADERHARRVLRRAGPVRTGCDGHTRRRPGNDTGVHDRVRERPCK